jgi:DNA-binding MarR family transcriptional regulator
MTSRFQKFSYAISQITRYWHKITADEMAPYDLKGPHAVYLVTLGNYPDGLTATELGELCGKDKADVSRAVAQLERKGFVVREGAGKNLYRAPLRLTQAGWTASEQVCRRAELAISIAGKELTDEDREVLYRCLDIIAGNLRTMSKEGLPPDQSSTEF